MYKQPSFILIIYFLSLINLPAQVTEPEHKLLWRISSAELSHDSYLYGTMHLSDPRVFNFSDSLYVKIEECKNFALEIHPDTMIKYLIVDPFNSQVNQGFAELLEEDDEMKEINKELEKKTGLSLDGISKDNQDLIPLMMDKAFKKNKDKNTFLDAHLYHIARILEKNIVGLESVDDHKKALSQTAYEVPELKERIKAKLEKNKILDEFIEIYQNGDVEKLFEYGNYKMDSVLAYRNVVMVQTADQYLRDGGLFMAVGAAHLSGEIGMIHLLRNQGYTVEPVKATFSKKIINAELANRELEWVKERFPDEGLEVLIPDHSYNYLPESMVGVVKVRSYPDLGMGHFFFYSIVPVTTDHYDLDSMVVDVKNNIASQGGMLDGKPIDGQYAGLSFKELSYTYAGKQVKFRYMFSNNYLYSFGICKIADGELDKDVLHKFFNNIRFFDIEKKANTVHTDEMGAFALSTHLRPQKFTEVDDASDFTSINEYTNFFDPESKLLNIILYTQFEAGHYLENSQNALDGYETNFMSANDSLVYIKDSERFGGKEMHVNFSDGTFMKALGFIRGNRLYQVFSSGAHSEENSQKADNFIQSFDTISYSSFGYEAFHNKNFSTYLASSPSLDTLNEFYELEEYSSEAVIYNSMDPNTGIQVSVKECIVSPYATYGNIDSCFNRMQELYKSYNDTLMYATSNYKVLEPEFSLCTRNSINQLDYRTRVLLDGDKLYQITVVQDSAAVSKSALNKFLDNFKLKNRTGKTSLLFRDSSVVKTLIINDLQSSDTTVLKASAAALSNFSFTEKEIQKIKTQYLVNAARPQPDVYHNSLIYFLSNQEDPGLHELLEPLYLNEENSDALRLTILTILINKEDEGSIALAKQLLQHRVPRSNDSWAISSIFDYVDNNKILEPLFPEIIDLGVVDSVIILNYLFYSLLDEEVINYEVLSPIHSLIELNAHKYVEAFSDNNDETEYYQYAQSSMMYAFSNENEKAKNICLTMYEDTTSYYYRLEGIKCLLRQGESPDLTKVYQEFNQYYAVFEMYDIERRFEGVKLLPDSMQNVSKYALVSTMANAEDMEYFDSATIKNIETYEEQGFNHYFIEADLYYEDGETVYPILAYAVVDLKYKGPFPYDQVYVNYWSIGEGSLENAKQSLKEFYTESLSQKK